MAQNNTKTPATKTTVNRWLLAVICFFLGYLGVHRFMVRKIGTGIIYLFTLGIFGIGVLVDFIMILAGMFTDKEGNEIK